MARYPKGYKKVDGTAATEADQTLEYKEFFTNHKGLTFYIDQIDASGKSIMVADRDGNNRLKMRIRFDFIPILNLDAKGRRIGSSWAKFDVDQEIDRKYQEPGQRIEESRESLRRRVVEELLDMRSSTPLLKIKTRDEYLMAINPDRYVLEKQIAEKDKRIAEVEQRIAELEAKSGV